MRRPATSLAFLFASTSLVLELGIVLYALMGWQFTAGEWIGGLVMVAVMSLLPKAVYPEHLVEEARRHEEEGSGHNHMSMTVDGVVWLDRLRKPEARVRVAPNFVMEWSEIGHLGAIVVLRTALNFFLQTRRLGGSQGALAVRRDKIFEVTS